ncbi:uncharacterized protein B0I36DRAFT_233338 [Microdochium trichocladiopsis]|uniref:AAA+ ATPase domain-containing protein n=1 Tax=Microdochium trichocladiopsis TaxID=1682393 RepID=A0A9P8YGA8_9PEZI|nr:uncharacterized protein B0I36DRAFT_233338 [Microdochium trichocladiopsis]KAH7041177.1 hypothetical protein B0I36DRAFT_233338 [Microdochium trichocladiopsis]
MPSKRKRDNILDFDPNKSDSEDENFDPSANRPSPPNRKRSRQSRNVKKSSRGERGGGRYRGSDIDDDDDDILEDSDEGSFIENDDEDDEDEEAVNATTGRRQRKTATRRQTYKESSEDDDDAAAVEETDKDELDDTPKKIKGRPTKIIKLKLTPAAMRNTRTTRGASREALNPIKRATRSNTVDRDDEMVELSNSGKHALPAKSSRSRSPEALGRATRLTRGGKGIKAPSVIEEATQEGSRQEEDNDADAMQDDTVLNVPDDKGEESGNVADATVEIEDQPMETVEEDADADEDDEMPIQRRTRGSRSGAAGAAAAEDANADSPEKPATRGRLTRGSRARKSMAEPSSDFDPNEVADDNDDGSDDELAKDNGDDEDESSTPTRGRKSSRAKSRGSRRSRMREESDVELDPDELADELEELKADRPRRRRQRTPEPHLTVPSKRVRAPVNYTIPALNQINLLEDEENNVPTPARRRGRATAASGWDHSLLSLAGPFGGVDLSKGALFNGPWGTGAYEAAGGADPDSSDDEGAERGGANMGVGVTPTAATHPAILNTAGAAGPNVGKIKDRKALADADPLGVDMSVDFSQVGGMQNHIDQLKEMVQLPLLYPQLFLNLKITPPRGVLFHGPPGTGKTLLARALANSIGFGGKKISFYMRKGADALSKWVGEAEKQLRLLFEEARKTQPSIIFFDEIDGLAPVRSSKQEQIHASIVSTLLALMDGMDGRGQVIVIGATNRPDNIDPALRRPGRFDREFYFPLPDVDARKSILDIHTKDWGLSQDFKQSLAKETKGYGGADLRSLCTEAGLNAIQRTYPQIYMTSEQLLVDPSKIHVQMSDFVIAKRKIIASSQRSSTSAAAPLPKVIQPLLRDQVAMMKGALDAVLPRTKKATALEEAMLEPYDDEDFGHGREALFEEFERSRTYRPRLLICGSPGMGQSYIGPALLHHLEGVHVQSFDLATVVGDVGKVEEKLLTLFKEVKRHQPSVIFIPNVDAWYHGLSRTGEGLETFLTLLRSLQPADPVLLLATADKEAKYLDPELKRDLFGFSSRNCIEIARPFKENRQEYFARIIDHIRRSPKDFPNPVDRKKRVLETLPVAPPPPPKKQTKEEMRKASLDYRRLLNLLKVNLQPIMDQINRKYRLFRNPVLVPAQYDYLFAEQDPNFVSPDIAGQPRPYEIDQDSKGTNVLRETATGKFFYNMDIVVIEERLANGYYISPFAFLRDIYALDHDAKAHGVDKQRILKASELLSNVEVDIQDVNTKFNNDNVTTDWEGEFRKEQERREIRMERRRKKAAMQSVVDSAQANGTGAQNTSQNGQPPRLNTTTAHFQVIGDLANGMDEDSPSPAPAAVSSDLAGAPPMAGEDTQMTDADSVIPQRNPAMQPPSQWPRIEQRPVDLSARATAGADTQLSQVSAVQALPPGVSPSALANDASTTKTSDPSNRSSNFSTQLTNGAAHGEHSSPGEQIPDTQPLTQHTSSDEHWMHSQAHAVARGYPNYSQGSAHNTSPVGAKSSQVASVANLLNSPLPDDASQSQLHSNSAASQHVEVDDASADVFQMQLTSRTSGCTIEQLEQISRELMSEIWRTRGEHNRMKVLNSVTRIFNETINDIESMQRLLQASQ